MNPPNPENPADPHCDDVAIKLPKFWAYDPESWFFNVEAQFALRRISRPATKLQNLLAVMEPAHIKEITDVLRNAETNNYDSVKAAILKRFGESEEEKLNKLLGPLELGDRSPSQLLREIQRLAGPNAPQAIIRGIWTKRLSPQTQQILQVADNVTLDKQAELADKIVSVHVPFVASTSSASGSPAVASTSSAPITLQSLAEEVRELSKQVRQLMNRRPRSRSRGRSVARSRENASENTICRFHQKFGDDAYRCLHPYTGSELSVLPPSREEKKNTSSFTLYAANETPIKTYGQRLLNLDLGLRRIFPFVFTLADVSRPIIGADFLQHFGLLVDIKCQRLLDRVTTLTSQGTVTSRITPSISTTHSDIPPATQTRDKTRS
ncbi:multicellular organismal development [Nesidiocoris tenuis]|uniref:Multicellular organismal development n=1 Tax=Nesidiocoris tenuis TaxID=355587 RepID=A0ABN7AY24_9HEMI|nr:multicellular organismal development [Nesidiocoris tenuis]